MDSSFIGRRDGKRRTTDGEEASSVVLLQKDRAKAQTADSVTGWFCRCPASTRATPRLYCVVFLASLLP